MQRVFDTRYSRIEYCLLGVVRGDTIVDALHLINVNRVAAGVLNGVGYDESVYAGSAVLQCACHTGECHGVAVSEAVAESVDVVKSGLCMHCVVHAGGSRCEHDLFCELRVDTVLDLLDIGYIDIVTAVVEDAIDGGSGAVAAVSSVRVANDGDSTFEGVAVGEGKTKFFKCRKRGKCGCGVRHACNGLSGDGSLVG